MTDIGDEAAAEMLGKGHQAVQSIWRRIEKFVSDAKKVSVNSGLGNARGGQQWYLAAQDAVDRRKQENTYIEDPFQDDAAEVMYVEFESGEERDELARGLENEGISYELCGVEAPALIYMAGDQERVSELAALQAKRERDICDGVERQPDLATKALESEAASKELERMAAGAGEKVRDIKR